MFKKNLITRTLRNAALVGLVGSLAYPVLAQETPVDEESVEKIKVTGSRIKRTELSTPAPIVSVSKDVLEADVPAPNLDGLSSMVVARKQFLPPR